MSYYEKVKKSNSHNTQRLSSIKGRTIIHAKEGGLFSQKTHRPLSSSVIIINPASDVSIRELADEQQRAVASLTRRIDNIETNLDQQQFNVFQQQLAMTSLPPPSENLEDFEREYTQKLADMHAEIQELRIELLQRANDTKEITRELTFEPHGLGTTPENLPLHEDLAALKVEWQSELKTNKDTLTELLKTNLQNQNQKYMQDLQQIQTQLEKQTMDGITLQTLQKQLQEIKSQLTAQTQDLANVNITLASKSTVEDVKMQVDELKKATQEWVQSASDLSLSTKSLESKVESLQVLHGQLSQLKSDMGLAVAQSNKNIQSSISQWKTDMDQQLSQKIQSVEAKLREERLQQEKNNSTLTKHNAKLDELESSVSNIMNEVQSRVAAVEDSNLKVQSRVAAVEDSNLKVQSRVAEVEESTINVQKRVADVEESTLNVQKRVADVEESTLNVQKRVADVEESTLNVQKRVADVEESTLNVQKRVADVENLLDQVSSQLGEFSLSIPQILDKRLGTLVYLQDELQKHISDTSVADRLSVVEKEWKRDRDSLLGDLSRLQVLVSHAPQVDNMSAMSSVGTELMVEIGNKLSRMQESHDQTISSLRSELKGYYSDELERVKLSLHSDSLKQVEEKWNEIVQQVKTKANHDEVDMKVSQVTDEFTQQLESKIRETKYTIDADIDSKIKQIAGEFDRQLESKIRETNHAFNTDLDSKVTHLCTRIDTLDSTVHDSVQSGVTDVKNELQQFKMEVITKQSLVDHLRSQLDELSQTLQERHRSIEGELSKLKNDVVYKEQIEVADTVTDEFEDKLARIKTEFHADLESKMHKLQEEVQLLIDQKLSKIGGENTSLEEKLNQEVMQYRQQIQSLSSYLQEMQVKSANELSSIKEEYNSTVLSTRDQVQSHIEDCQKEIQGVESRLVSILAELELVHQENKTVSQSVQAHTEETRAAVTDLKEGHSSLFAQIPPIRENILDIEKRISEIKHEFDAHADVHNKKSIQQNERIGTLDQKVDLLEQKTEKRTLDLSEACKYLDAEYKMISDTFKSQYEVLQKRYQELHTIIVSNMEETERGNQSVRELIELHTRIEQEYKDMTNSYERQQQEYKTSLQKRDDRLKLLEDQVKTQLDNVDQRLTMIQNDDVSKTGSLTHSARIEELAQPRHITPKKIL
jgi:chromosome segregation ATPase